jgi:hypothetical protein
VLALITTLPPLPSLTGRFRTRLLVLGRQLGKACCFLDIRFFRQRGKKQPLAFVLGRLLSPWIKPEEILTTRFQIMAVCCLPTLPINLPIHPFPRHHQSATNSRTYRTADTYRMDCRAGSLFRGRSDNRGERSLLDRNYTCSPGWYPGRCVTLFLCFNSLTYSRTVSIRATRTGGLLFWV